MRKLFIYDTNGLVSTPMETTMVARNSSSLYNISRTLISETPSVAPSKLPFEDYYTHQRRPYSIIPFIPLSDTVFDLATLFIIFALIVLSLLCISFIFHLRLKSRWLHHLQDFNSYWIVRLVLIIFSMVWALNEVLRLPLFRMKYLYPFLPLLSLTQQSNLCKMHVVLSYGFLQPGFLITLLFLVNVSLQKKNPHFLWAFASICTLCCPLMIIQIYFVFHSPFQDKLPMFMYVTSLISSDFQSNKMVLCSYPLLSCIIFSGFAIAYSLAFLVSSWRVVAFVINKSIRARINVLSLTVMISLPIQIICLGISPLWLPQDPIYSLVELAMFLDVAFCMAVGQIILVLKPIADALSAGGNSKRKPEIRLQAANTRKG